MKRMLVQGLSVIIFISLSLMAQSKAEVVWSDNFDDGNLDGWTISGSATPLIVDKTLQSPNPDFGSFVSHQSMITTGTWSYDCYWTKEGGDGGYTQFIDNPTNDESNGYEIRLSSVGSILFMRWDNGALIGLNPGASFKPRSDSWTHVDVTRDSNGRWILYVNGTLIMDKVDAKYSSINYFGFVLGKYSKIDNVVVSDTIYVPPGSLKVTVKDSGGNALSGVGVSSSKQPSGQVALSGTTAADGTVTFTELAIGNYTFQVSKSGYVSGSVQGSVASGAKTELSSTLQAQPSSGIPGFPTASLFVGISLCVAWLWLSKRRLRQLTL